MEAVLETVRLLRPTERADAVRQVEVPALARALCTLSRVDYQDSFLVDTDQVGSRTAEQWARAMLEGPSPATRRALRYGWFALGLRLGSPRSDQRVLGWELRRNTLDVALLGADSPLGLHGEVLLNCQRRSLLFATFVQLDNPVARAVWAQVAPGHRRVVRNLLDQAIRRTSASA